MLNKSKVKNLENSIDTFIINSIDSSYPLYKYIYHLNLAHINYVVENNLLFTLDQRHINFSLTANIYWAYIKLTPESLFNISFDTAMYLDCYEKIKYGFTYSLLCDEFTKVNSNLSSISSTFNNVYKFNSIKFPRENWASTHEFSKLNTLDNLLRKIIFENISAGNTNIDSIVYSLSKEYCDLLAEQLKVSDFKHYKFSELKRFSLYIFQFAMKGYFEYLRKGRVDIPIIPKVTLPSLAKNLDIDIDSLNKIINDHIYKPIGNGYFPKCTLSDAPIIRTDDNSLILNPLLLLSNYIDTRYLSYMRKLDNVSYTNIKNDISERHLELITSLLLKSFKNISIIKNLNIKKYNNKDSREVDLLIFDDSSGYGIYVEIKYFYTPISFSEKKYNDIALNSALVNIKSQINDIKRNWHLIKKQNNFKSDLIQLDGIILPYDYVGINVPIDANIPIINRHMLYQNIIVSKNINELFINCKKDQKTHNLPLLSKKTINLNFDNKDFIVDVDYIPPYVSRTMNLVAGQQLNNYLKFSKQIDFMGTSIDSQKAADILFDYKIHT